VLLDAFSGNLVVFEGIMSANIGVWKFLTDTIDPFHNRIGLILVH
jgi:hypothetical protein